MFVVVALLVIGYARSANAVEFGDTCTSMAEIPHMLFANREWGRLG